MKKVLFLFAVLFSLTSCYDPNAPVDVDIPAKNQRNFEITFTNNSHYDAVFLIDNKAAAFVDPGYSGTKKAMDIQQDQQFYFINLTKEISVELLDYDSNYPDFVVATYRKTIYFDDQCDYEVVATDKDITVYKLL